MSSDQDRVETEWRLTPAAVHGVRFSRASRVHPGYADTEVDAFRGRVELELQRLTAEKAELREQVHALRRSVEAHRADAEAASAREAPAQEEVPVQAVHILAAAQQTADQYVAEAEDFSRRIAGEAREHYEQVVQQARAEADTVLREAASLAAVAREAVPAPAQEARDVQEEVAYLKAFGQACRTQLRSYLEALLDDVEHEWGRADPQAVAARTHRSPGEVRAGATTGAAANGTGGANGTGADRADRDDPPVEAGVVVDVRR
ncbi:cell division protein DivIVA [Kineococcus sp. T13]|uniref:DivIVA domain-containing protein n=1 Tax=Kineococcus vitellinus TaxID=2696565 RepID=UPI0014128EC2|nr:DivIVA domain-containing protein [Kineococcus vitellinus]NAZ75864.1 cell division protein DivIVA [Kineococcus vitellinus]